MSRDDCIVVLRIRIRDTSWTGKEYFVYLVYWKQGFDFCEVDEFLRDVEGMRVSGTLHVFGSRVKAMEYAGKLDLHEGRNSGYVTTEQGICTCDIDACIDLTAPEIDKINPVWGEFCGESDEEAVRDWDG